MAERKTKPQKFARIYALGDERVDALNNMLARGTPAMAVAKHIQKVWGAFADVSEKSLTQQINRYKLQMVASPVTVKEEAQPPDSPKRQYVKGQLNTLHELERLAELQIERLEIAMARERTIKMPMKGTGAEVVIMQNLLERIQKMRFDLGIDAYQGPAMSRTVTGVARFPVPGGMMTVGVKEEVLTQAVDILARLEQEHDPNVIEGEVVSRDPREV